MKMNTNSNVYTIVYAAVMVIIVAFLLAFVSSSLKDRQDNNVRKDVKKQILAALNIDATDANVDATYDQVITDNLLNGTELTPVPSEDFKTSYNSEIKSGNYHVFVAKLENGETKYVFPVYGAGLWGPIWGYV
jgi:Na+-transporting NADH:ubiquinone oxidoreductase subunit C